MVAVATACTGGATPASSVASVGPGASAPAASAAPPASVEPSPSASAAASEAIASPSAASGGGAARNYKCDDVITNAEIQAASGVADLARLGDRSDSSPDGLTDCGYFGKGGAL